MSTENQSSIAKFALNDILLGIAQGLNDAQNQLKNMPPYDEYGRPNTMYQLPYLDFELKVSSEFEEIRTEETIETPDTAAAGTGKIDKFPIMYATPKASFKFSTNTKTESSANVQMVSTISGRFVANLPNEGMPQVILSVKTITPVVVAAETRIDIEASLSNVTGELFKNSLIEFNFDIDTSLQINGTNLFSTPRFSVSEVRTDAQGIARTQFFVKTVDYNSTKNITFIVIVGAGSVKKSISICKK